MLSLVSMKMMYEVKCLHFFNTLDSEFHSDGPDDDDDERDGEDQPRCKQVRDREQGERVRVEL